MEMDYSHALGTSSGMNASAYVANLLAIVCAGVESFRAHQPSLLEDHSSEYTMYGNYSWKVIMSPYCSFDLHDSLILVLFQFMFFVYLVWGCWQRQNEWKFLEAVRVDYEPEKELSVGMKYTKITHLMFLIFPSFGFVLCICVINHSVLEFNLMHTNICREVWDMNSNIKS